MNDHCVPGRVLGTLNGVKQSIGIFAPSSADTPNFKKCKKNWYVWLMGRMSISSCKMISFAIS